MHGPADAQIGSSVVAAVTFLAGAERGGVAPRCSQMCQRAPEIQMCIQCTCQYATRCVHNLCCSNCACLHISAPL